jgi:hypothetical protein
MNLVAFLFSFCGGAFGAALGSLGAFEFTGITGLLGVIAGMAGAKFDWFGLIPFGVFFGPHISFAGGAAAAAYARKKGYLQSGKDIAKALVSLKKPSVLAVGGIMGMLGYGINVGIATVMPGKIDTVAFTVMIVALIAKVIFGSTGLGEIFGQVPEEIKKLGGRYSRRSPGVWIGYVNTTAEKTMVALAAGGCSAYITYVMLQNPVTAPVAIYVGFCISATSLLWLQFGAEIPVTHHITMCASYAVLASGGSLLWGMAGAVVAAFAGDFLGRTFYVYGDCHVDPPAMGIAFTSLVFLGILPQLGMYHDAYIVPIAVVALAVIASLIEVALRNSRKVATAN